MELENKLDKKTEEIKNKNIYFKLMEDYMRIYNLIPYKNYSLDEINKLFTESIKKSVHIRQYLQESLKWNEVYLYSIGKMVSILDEFAFPELEHLSLRFILLFTIENNSKDIMTERLNLLKFMPFVIDVNHEFNMESFIFFFYRCYGIIQTFLGVTVWFFVFLNEEFMKETKFSEQNLKRLMKKHLIDSDEDEPNEEEYHALEYLNLIEDRMQTINKDFKMEQNLVSFLKKLVEYFLKVKVGDYFAEKDLGDFIEKNMKNPHENINVKNIDFKDFLDNFPEFYSPIRNFYQVLTGTFLESEEDKVLKEKVLNLLN